MRSLWKEKSYESIVTVPNIITSAGIILLIPYVWGFLTNHRWIMFISLFLSGFSDLPDGFLARKLKQCTRIGKIIDSSRDQLLRIAILTHVLYLMGLVVLWGWCGVILLLEAAVIIAHSFLNPVQQAKRHFLREMRRMGHVFIFGAVLLSLYFRDIIFALFGFDFDFSFNLALPLMAICSCIALIWYMRNIFPKN